MGKAKYLAGRILNMHYKQFFNTINEIHKKSGKNRLSLLCDCIYCGFKYQAGYMDYKNSCIYNLNKEQREDILTRGVINEYVARYNDKNYTHHFANKEHFNKTFADYLKRDWVLVKGPEDKDKFLAFCKGKEDFILKPLYGEGGEGVTKLPATEESFDSSVNQIPYIAEEKLIQVDEMNSLNSTSINTLRFMTFVKDNKSYVLAVFLRMGRGGLVDNFCGGGMVTPVDAETGKVSFPACNGDCEAFDVHPITGTPIVGFQIPHFEEVKKMVLEAALVVPQVRFVGWDVAISVNGPCLIEGNDYPAYFYNFPEHHPDGRGLRHVFEDIMNS